jgi:uncharacterized protein
MSILSLSIVGAAIFLSAFISGVFAIAGGMILLGALLAFFDVPTAMVLFSVLSSTANLWRVIAYRRYIDWRIWMQYVVGAALAFAILRSIAFIPSKAMVYLLIGLLPFLVEVMPRHWHPSIEWRGMPAITGCLTSTLQLIGGNGGVFLNIFFQKSTIDRKTTVATKSVCQTVGNVLRILYFGTLHNVTDVLPLWTFAPAVLLAVGGTLLALPVLERMTDYGFRRWTGTLIFVLSVVYLARAAWLFWHGF